MCFEGCERFFVLAVLYQERPWILPTLTHFSRTSPDERLTHPALNVGLAVLLLVYVVSEGSHQQRSTDQHGSLA